MPPNPITHNTLFYGDNLPILRDYVADASVDLVYLDPPFNSNRSYNVLFRDESGQEAEAQITAFDDTWHWNVAAERTYHELATAAPDHVARMIGALREFIGNNQMMAYLVMMAARLVELHRVLKPTGSLYLHCDPTASHYLKIILDSVFGPENFVNEMIWKRTSAHSDVMQGARHFGRIHDVLLFYAKTELQVWNSTYLPYDEEYVEKTYRYTDEEGRRYQTQPLHAAKPGGDTLYEWKGQFPPKGRYWAFSKENMEKLEAEGRIVYSKNGVPRYRIYLDQSKGVPTQDLWTDISPVHNMPRERLGYPTQKPVALLERIIQASSNPGDVVLDPFCGCGTAIIAAQKLGRRWIGIDITHLSIALQKNRLKDSFGLEPKRDYVVIGEPEDLAAARQLAQDDRYQFQWWALSLVGARPVGGRPTTKDEGRTSAPSVVGRPSAVGKKGSDKGVDGVITFLDDKTGKPKRILVQVKSGHVKSGDVRDLRGAVEREAAALGIFITLEPATADMQTEAVAAGFYHSPGWNRDYPRLQILTVGDLLHGVQPQMPPTAMTFKQAPKAEQGEMGQPGLGL